MTRSRYQESRHPYIQSSVGSGRLVPLRSARMRLLVPTVWVIWPPDEASTRTANPTPLGRPRRALRAPRRLNRARLLLHVLSPQRQAHSTARRDVLRSEQARAQRIDRSGRGAGVDRLRTWTTGGLDIAWAAGRLR